MRDWIYIHDLSPWVVRVEVLGVTLGLRWYGLAYLVGFALAWWYLRQAVRANRVRGLDATATEDLLIGILAGVILGGRLAFVLQHPGRLLADPLFLFRFWEGGMTFFGGLLGVILAVAWVTRRHRLRFLELTDVLVFPAALALGLGRIANFINGELVGQPTGGGWGVVFPEVDRVPRHPSQLYEAGSHFLLFGLLVLAARRWPGWSTGRVGRLSFLFLAGYGLFRFLTHFYRADETYLGPFSTGQWVSLLLAIISIGWLGWSARRARCVERQSGQSDGPRNWPKAAP